MSAHLRSDVGMLQEDCALEILAAVQTGAQDEMAIQQRAGFAEKREKVFAHVVGRFDSLAPASFTLRASRLCRPRPRGSAL